jgi:cytochrome c oxidase assembly factor CtaG/putative copper export protein
MTHGSAEPPPAAAASIGPWLSLPAVVVVVGLLSVPGHTHVAGAAETGTALHVGLPVARLVHDLAAAVTIGLLVVGTWLVAPEKTTSPAGALDGARLVAVRAAGHAALGWLAAGLVGLVLTAAEVSGVPVEARGFGGVLLSFAGQLDLGRALGWSALLVAGVAALAFLATRAVTSAWAAVLAVLALWPLALTGHAADSRGHMNSVDSLVIHLLAVCLWVGGLAAVLLLARTLGGQLPTVVARYSRLAGWCFAAVAASGVVNATLRLSSWGGLASPYGLLVLGKTAALLVLGAAGYGHRTWAIRRLGQRPRLFFRLAGVELAVMVAAVGLAVTLSRSAPPGSATPVDRVSALLGAPAPPPLTTDRFFSAFYPDLLWLTVALLAAGLYLAGAVRLWRRGDRWSRPRLLAWLAGCALLVFVTSGGPGVYGRLQFSIHTLQHMILMIAVPLLWVLGAPITLALRALARRTDRSLGARETLLTLVHSAPLRLLGHPVVAGLLFASSLVVFYYSRIFELAMFTHTGHVLMVVHFLGVGYLFTWCLIGVDPGARRPGYPFRLLLLLVMLGVHAFFGISLMSNGTLLAPDWWHALGQTDDAALLADQQRGGAIAWAAGDVPSLLLGLALLVNWVRDDSRRARQLDRQADRDQDAALRAHNDRLAALARRDGTP